MQPRAVNVDLQTDATLQVDISDALSERDKVKFTVHTKVGLTYEQQHSQSWWDAQGPIFCLHRVPSQTSSRMSSQWSDSTKNSSGFMTRLWRMKNMQDISWETLFLYLFYVWNEQKTEHDGKRQNGY